MESYVDRLYQIICETTVQLRKGDVIEEKVLPGIVVTEVYAMPHESEVRPDVELVDMELLTIGVDRVKAEQNKGDLIALLDSYPDADQLAGGPSYITVGAEIGDQGAALQLFALGKVLGLWDVITPWKLGLKGPEARNMAGSGFVMITGYNKSNGKGK